MNDGLTDYTNGMFKTIATAQVFSAEGELGEKIIANANNSFFTEGRDRWDLFPFFSILVSTGWNKNTDVFDFAEVWQARNSPKHKALNWMHEQQNIIGHMTDAMVTDKDYNPIPEESAIDAVPNKIHIITASYLYRVWEDPKKQMEINNIIKRIQAGELFVSMECLFKNFDYAFMDAQGGQRLLARSADTVFLSKFLRQYGGTGEYQGHTIGRLLRDITFSAQGIVEKPANPDSIISDKFNFFNSEANESSMGYITLDQLHKETCMADTVLQTAELKRFDITESPEYKSLASKLEVATAKLDEISKANLDNLKRALAEKDEEFDNFKKKKAEADKDVEKEKEDMKAECAKKDKEVEDAKAALQTALSEVDAERKTRQAYEEASRTKSRVEAFMQKSGFDKTEATKKVEQFKDLSDTVFASMLELVTTKNAPKTITTSEKVVASTETVESNPPLGSTAENTLEVTRAQVKEFFNAKKGS